MVAILGLRKSFVGRPVGEPRQFIGLEFGSISKGAQVISFTNALTLGNECIPDALQESKEVQTPGQRLNFGKPKDGNISNSVVSFISRSLLDRDASELGGFPAWVTLVSHKVQVTLLVVAFQHSTKRLTTCVLKGMKRVVGIRLARPSAHRT
jgi:hypothetical protein